MVYFKVFSKIPILSLLNDDSEAVMLCVRECLEVELYVLRPHSPVSSHFPNHMFKLDRDVPWVGLY